MKTKEQTIRYLSRRSFSDADWKAVLQKCHSLYGSGVRKALRPKQSCTYQEFIDWLDKGMGDGTIVSCGDLVGLFCDNGDGTYKLLAHYAPDGKIKVEDIPVEAADVSQIDSADFYRDLRKQGLQYSVTLSTIYERKMPSPYSKVAYTHNGVKCIGFLRKCVGGMAHFICGYETDFEKDYSVPLTDIDFYSISKDGVKRLRDEMNHNGVSFDRKTMKLVNIISRAKMGGTYWYLSDILSICRGVEKHLAKDNARYENYNYFLNYEEVLAFRDKILELRKATTKGKEELED